MVPRNIRKLTLALVGQGKWGSNYIRTISTLKNCVLPNKYIVTRNYRDLIKYKDIDGVIIATPAESHFEIAKFFLENKYNILIEKPVTLKYSEVQELVSLQRKYGVVGIVGHIYEYHPRFQKLLTRVERTKIKYIYTEGVGDGPVRTDVSALWDWAPHDIGMCISLMGEVPAAVACWEITKKALYAIKLQFPSGVTAVSRIGWLAPYRKRLVLVHQGDQVLVFEDSVKQISLAKSPLAIELEEFVSCIIRNKTPLTDFSYGGRVIKTIEALEKSAIHNGQLITLK